VKLELGVFVVETEKSVPTAVVGSVSWPGDASHGVEVGHLRRPPA